MRGAAFLLAALAVIGLAFWAYRENYATQESLAEVEQLQRDIGALRETAGVLSAEWAYLNRPDRLRELAALNFDKLSLMPLEPGQFGAVEQASYPTPQVPDDLSGLSQPVDMSGSLGSGP